jgi:uncharacterized protein
MSEKKPLVPCPQCGKEVIFDSRINPFRPFCSERCKLIDLGQWANGAYSVPVKDSAPQILLDPDDTHQS